MATIWDLYLDAADAAAILDAAATFERHRWVREPLPLTDVECLLARLRTIATIAAEDVDNWGSEAEDRLVEARGDGGRWGSPEAAIRMATIALGLVEGSREVLEAARAALVDLAARLEVDLVE